MPIWIDTISERKIGVTRLFKLLKSVASILYHNSKHQILFIDTYKMRTDDSQRKNVSKLQTYQSQKKEVVLFGLISSSKETA
jgi:hypothetical protein